MCLILQRIRVQVQVLKPCKSIQESSEEVLFIKTRQKARQMYLLRFNIQSSTDSSTTVSIKNYEIQISRSIFHAYPSYVFRFSFLITLNIYKDYFKSHLTWCKGFIHAYYDWRQSTLFHLSLEEATAFVSHMVLWPRSFLIFIFL